MVNSGRIIRSTQTPAPLGVRSKSSGVLADATAAALLALAALPPVLAEATAAAVLALGALPPVLADATAAALLADVAPPLRGSREGWARGR